MKSAAQPRLRLGGPVAFAVALLVATGIWLGAALNPAAPWARLLDNLHWTFSYSFAALMVWQELPYAGREDRGIRRWLAIGLTCLACGQWIWDVQSIYGWTPFPGPSDAAFVLPGLCALLGFAHVARTRLQPAELRMATVDVAGFAVAALALTLAVYLPRGLSSSPLQVGMFTLYPVLLMSASAAALVTHLYLRLRWSWRWVAVIAGLMGQAAVWMQWNVGMLDGSLANGAPLNLAFSLVTLTLGWGAAGWRLERDAGERYDRHCEGIIRQLPLVMVAMTTCTVGLLMLDAQLPEMARLALVLLALAVLSSAPFRQSMQLSERDRMLAAERGLAESRAQLEHMAHHDALTGLANLALLRLRVEEAIAAARQSGKSVALLFIDLDQFKEVNDTLGHDTGDALLIHTARELESVLRSTDTISRHGGDEFVVVLPGVNNIGEVTRVADKLMRLASGSAQVNGHELPLAMSIGAAVYPHDAQSFESLLQCADVAMYEAKAAGRNAYRFYDAQMRAEASERMLMRGRLARAIERGELRLHYQPVIDLHNGRILGAEALLRWEHPELGSVSPESFIAVAEDSGLIVPIGDWVLQEACRQGAAWQAAGMAGHTIAVNLSVLQFRRGNLEESVLGALRASGLAPGWLELEVTESVMMEDGDKVTATLDRLRRLGVRVAIDDFGTGYSSLGYLKRLPAGKLKIDRTLISEIDSNPRDAGMARAVIQIGRQLGLTTVAEGVETARQAQLLEDFGCDAAQGFLYSRPVAPAEFEALVQARNQSPPAARVRA